MRDIKLGSRLWKEVVLLKKSGNKIVETKNVTWDFNQIVISMFRKWLEIKWQDWRLYKVNVEECSDVNGRYWGGMINSNNLYSTR